MSKGKRASLENLLRSAGEVQQKRKKWAEMHPSTNPDRPPEFTSTQYPRTDERVSLWKLWEAGAVVVGLILALEATSVWPLLYWPGVLIVCFGLAGIVIKALRGKWHRHWAVRSAIAAIGGIFFACWIFGFVLAKADLNATSQANPGDLRLYLINSTDYDFTNLIISVSSDNIVARITQLEPACQNFNFFSGAPPVSVSLRDNDTGKTFWGLPTGPSLSTGVHLICGELPRHSTATFVVALMATDLGKNPGNPFPQQLTAPTRLPEWFSIDGDYRALGKTRPLHFRWTY